MAYTVSVHEGENQVLLHDFPLDNAKLSLHHFSVTTCLYSVRDDSHFVEKTINASSEVAHEPATRDSCDIEPPLICTVVFFMDSNYLFFNIRSIQYVTLLLFRVRI